MSLLNLPSHTLLVVAFILLLLVFASVVVYQKQQKRPEKDYAELVMRTKSWWWMIGLVVLALAFGRVTTILFLMVLSLLALREFYAIVPLREVDRKLALWTYVAVPVQYGLVYMDWYGMFIVFIPVYMFLFLPLRSVLIGETKGVIKSNAVIQWGLMLCVFAFSHIAFLTNLAPAQHEKAGYAGLVLLLLFLTQFNDVAQYVSGKTFGKHKIIPKVSPNKTWEGFIGGVCATSLLACVIAPFLSTLTHAQGLFAGLLIAGAGFVGDVVISSVKRDLEIKDSGTLIPGHGGLLDRIDSLIYTAPLFFHFLYYLKC